MSEETVSKRDAAIVLREVRNAFQDILNDGDCKNMTGEETMQTVINTLGLMVTLYEAK